MIVALFSLWAGAAQPVGGTHAAWIDIVTATRVPVFGETRVTTRSVALVEMWRQGDAWQQRQVVCDVQVTSASPATTTLPLAFVRSIPVQVHAISVEQHDGRWTYVADPGPTAVGFDPALTGGALPSSADDPGVVDVDRDGHPGATVLLRVPVLGNVSVYVAQLGHTILRGVFDGDRVEGLVDVRQLEQTTLGASNRMFRSSPPTRVVPDESRFVMVKVPREARCSDLPSAPPAP